MYLSSNRLVLAVLLLAAAIFSSAEPTSSPAAAALPDGRVYELVSPTQKNGGIGGVFPLGELTHSVEQVGRPLQSSADGNSIIYRGEDFYEPQLGSLNYYFSTRSPAGWTTSNATPGVPSTSETAIEANSYRGFAADLSTGVLNSNVPLTNDPAVPARYANLYVAHGGSFEAFIRAKPPNRPARQFGYSHPLHGEEPILHAYLFFGGGNSGTPTVPAFSHMLFEANDALTPNAVDGGALADNLYEWTAGQLRLVNVLPNGEAPLNASFGVDHNDEYNNVPLPNLDHAISANGSRIFWTDQNSGNLYVREDGVRTKQIDASVGGGGAFQTANGDGSDVFFTKAGHLYEYKTDTEATRDLTGGGGVEGVLGTSEDGTHVYFVATSILVAGATAGKPNLYLSREGTVTFIATLSPNDNHTPELYGSGGTPEGDWYRTFAGRTARVSPNGRYVAFMSVASLTGYDNTDAVENQKDYEAFLYDSNEGTLVCASCNTDGSRPTVSTLLPAPLNGVYQQRYLDDAGHLFFSTADAVLPGDTNGVSDVYEYENGHVYLISQGTTNDEAVLADTSESGDDVFFTTRQQLVRADHDQIVDLYDARVGGRAEEPPLSPCGGETCNEPPSSSPSFEAPLSAAFSGPGNPLPAVQSVRRTKQVAARKKPHKKRRAKHRRHAKKPRSRKARR